MNEYQQDYLISKWLRSKGLTVRDIEQHPQITDVILLSHWRDALWDDANLSERSFWGTQWDWAYIRQYPLKKKMLTKLENITTIINNRQQGKQQQRLYIQSLRKAKQAF
jgi:hypothetical protein